jgi:hypothetical protein
MYNLIPKERRLFMNLFTLSVRNMLGAVVLFGLSATQAAAVDLTGKWEGEAVCKGFFNGKKFKETYSGEVLITQSGADLNMSFFGVLYNGGIINDAKNPDEKGQGSFVACGTTAEPLGDYNEIGRIIGRVKGAEGTFKATSIFTVASSGEIVDVATCKWKFTLMDTADPGVPDCSGESGS